MMARLLPKSKKSVQLNYYYNYIAINVAAFKSKFIMFWCFNSHLKIPFVNL